MSATTNGYDPATRSPRQRSSSAISGASTTHLRWRLRVLQSVTAGLDQVDLAAIPKRVTFCNVYGHEPAIAEYAITTMLVLDPSTV